jgi:hypothetical protein
MGHASVADHRDAGGDRDPAAPAAAIQTRPVPEDIALEAAPGPALQAYNLARAEGRKDVSRITKRAGGGGSGRQESGRSKKSGRRKGGCDRRAALGLRPRAAPREKRKLARLAWLLARNRARTANWVRHGRVLQQSVRGQTPPPEVVTLGTLAGSYFARTLSPDVMGIR